MKVLPTSVLTCLLVLQTPCARAADSPAGEKNQQGLTAILIAQKDTYTLDPSEQGKDVRDGLAKGVYDWTPLGLLYPPHVELTLRITNTSAFDITINLGGDDSEVQLKLEGPGAITVGTRVAGTTDFHMGTPTKIAPGKSIDIPIDSLAFRNPFISQHTYWTQPGDYTLSASLVYTVPQSPVGEPSMKVTSGKINLKVETQRPAKP